jgi:hypothetical protein
VIFYILSWIGVAFLSAAHLMFAFGGHKRLATWISAIGASIALISAAGLSIWAVAFLNLAWVFISLYGTTVSERFIHTPKRDLAAFAFGAVSGLAWLWGPMGVSWVVSATYLIAWFAFSTGYASRREYLIACVISASMLVPALLMVRGEAFAANEYLGMIIGLAGVWRSRREITVQSKETTVPNAGPVTA